jgi:hypothetical protein
MAQTLETDLIDMPEKVMPNPARVADSEKAEPENKAPRGSAARWVLLAF